jgi:hypothetical protein
VAAREEGSEWRPRLLLLPGRPWWWGVEELLDICISLVWSLGLVLWALFVFFLGVCWLHGGGGCCCG